MKKVISFMLSAVMVLSLFTVPVFAEANIVDPVSDIVSASEIIKEENKIHAFDASTDTDWTYGWGSGNRFDIYGAAAATFGSGYGQGYDVVAVEFVSDYTWWKGLGDFQDIAVKDADGNLIFGYCYNTNPSIYIGDGERSTGGNSRYSNYLKTVAGSNGSSSYTYFDKSGKIIFVIENHNGEVADTEYTGAYYTVTAYHNDTVISTEYYSGSVNGIGSFDGTGGWGGLFTQYHNLAIYAANVGSGTESHTVTVNYVDEDGNPIKNAVTVNVPASSSYTPVYDEVITTEEYKYTYVSGGDAKTITADTTINIVYSKVALAAVTIQRISNLDGRVISENVVKGLEPGASYTVSEDYEVYDIALNGTTWSIYAFDDVKSDSLTIESLASGDNTIKLYFDETAISESGLLEIRDASFDADTTVIDADFDKANWLVAGTWYTTSSAVKVQEDNGNYYLATTNGTAGFGQTIKVEAGVAYTIKAKVKSTEASPALWIQNPYYTWGATNGAANLASTAFDGDGEWHEVEITYTPNADKITVYMWADGAIDDLRIEEANTVIFAEEVQFDPNAAASTGTLRFKAAITEKNFTAQSYGFKFVNFAEGSDTTKTETKEITGDISVNDVFYHDITDIPKEAEVNGETVAVTGVGFYAVPYVHGVDGQFYYGTPFTFEGTLDWTVDILTETKTK